VGIRCHVVPHSVGGVVKQGAGLVKSDSGSRPPPLWPCAGWAAALLLLLLALGSGLLLLFSRFSSMALPSPLGLVARAATGRNPLVV